MLPVTSQEECRKLAIQAEFENKTKAHGGKLQASADDSSGMDTSITSNLPLKQWMYPPIKLIKPRPDKHHCNTSRRGEGSALVFNACNGCTS
jgi:hypothetical protein